MTGSLRKLLTFIAGVLPASGDSRAGTRESAEFERLRCDFSNVKRHSPKTVRFLDYQFDVPDGASFVEQFRDIFVNQIYLFVANSRSPVILDCGANIGVSCAYFRRLYPDSRITAFEADPAIAATLTHNMKQNGLQGIDIVAKAVWVSDVGVPFSPDGADGGSLFGANKTTHVPSIRLKDWIEDIEGGVDLLKLDIEGAETEVLLDARDSLSSVRNIFIEYHAWRNRAQRLDELLKVLRDAGFRYYIDPISQRRSPFINRGETGNMDLQLNVFAWQRHDGRES
jgi:FkbM family methyltransferase